MYTLGNTILDKSVNSHFISKCLFLHICDLRLKDISEFSFKCYILVWIQGKNEVCTVIFVNSVARKKKSLD